GGTVTVKSQFCSDGHDYADDNITVQVPSNSSHRWIVASHWAYASSHPDDVVKLMEAMYWNDQVVRVSFLTILPNTTAYTCSPQAPRSVRGFSISNVSVAAAWITDRDTAYLRFSYNAAVASDAEFFLCIDGTTVLSSQTRLGPGSSTYQAYQPMTQSVGTCQSAGCEEYGDARWSVVWNHQVVAQASFTVTP